MQKRWGRTKMNVKNGKERKKMKKNEKGCKKMKKNVTT